MLLSAIRSPDPVIFLEPKQLYRIAEEEVPEEDYMVPIGKAQVLRTGKDITVVSYGSQIRQVRLAAKEAKAQGIDVEIIDLRTIVPWDQQCVIESVKKTGRLIVTHEEQITSSFSGEVCSTIQEKCFLHLEAPIK